MKPWEEMTREERLQAEQEWRQSHRSTTEIAFERMGASMGAEPLPFDQVGERGQVIQAGVTGEERLRRLRDIDRTMLMLSKIVAGQILSMPLADRRRCRSWGPYRLGAECRRYEEQVGEKVSRSKCPEATLPSS
jgi:hypothetical protein